jgi:hypothetical protein
VQLAARLHIGDVSVNVDLHRSAAQRTLLLLGGIDVPTHHFVLGNRWLRRLCERNPDAYKANAYNTGDQAYQS